MSKVRYFIAIIVAIAVAIVLYSLLAYPDEFDFMLVILSYVAGALVGDLILEPLGLPLRLFITILSWIPRILSNLGMLFGDDRYGYGAFSFILAIILLVPCLSLSAIILFIAIVIPVLISAVTFIIHLITFAQDLY
mgnify:CR=1 FL=1